MILLADNEDPDHTEHARSLIWVFIVRICPKDVYAWRGSFDDYSRIILFFFTIKKNILGYSLCFIDRRGIAPVS